jgi:hypothetical protein
MLSWLPYRRARIERIEAEAEALIHDFGSAAYGEARQREHEASSDAMARDWKSVALAVAEKTGKRIGLDTSTQMARVADLAPDREQNTPDQIAELNRVLGARPPQFRVQYVGSGSLRVRSILKEVEIEASDVSAAVIAAANLEWPPKTIALRILDREGREVFGRQRGDR